MKNYRFIVPLALVLLMGVSWFKLISNKKEAEKEYNTYLAIAREKAELGITKYAIENYNNALNINDNIDVYVEIANYYKKNGDSKIYMDWCEQMVEKHPYEAKAYDCLLDTYMSVEDYTSCYSLIDKAERMNVNSNFIKNTRASILYKYKIEYSTYDDVAVFNNNYCAIKNKNLWGFVDIFGNIKVPCMYLEVGSFTNSKFVSVIDNSNNSYFIDKKNEKVAVAKENYKSYGSMSCGVVPAENKNGKYVYLDEQLKMLFGKYDFASTMNGDVAVIKDNNKWMIINSKGENISSINFDGFVLDENKIAFRNDRLFAKKDSKYNLIDSKGKSITSEIYEDAKLFIDETGSAVKINGKWGFIDKKGNIIIKPVYENARSFSNGLAAIQINGKWGFIDINNKVVIEPEYCDAKDFNDKGSCFVKVGDRWQLLKLYRLNREG